jgi:hypothetical protein
VGWHLAGIFATETTHAFLYGLYAASRSQARPATTSRSMMLPGHSPSHLRPAAPDPPDTEMSRKGRGRLAIAEPVALSHCWAARSLHVHMRLALATRLEAKPLIEAPGTVGLQHLQPHRKIAPLALFQNHLHELGANAAPLVLGQQGNGAEKHVIRPDYEVEHPSSHSVDTNDEPVAGGEALGEVAGLKRLIPTPGCLDRVPQGGSMYLPEKSDRPVSVPLAVAHARAPVRPTPG